MSNVYKQIPKTEDEFCPICHKKAVYYQPVKVLFYKQKNKSYTTRKVSLLKCTSCNICFADKRIFEQYFSKISDERPIFFNSEKAKSISELNKKTFSFPALFCLSQTTSKQTHKINNAEIVPLDSINFRSSIKTIYITPFLTECVNCRKLLSDYVNVIPINHTDCAKIKGKYCNKCNMFFYENSSYIEKILKNNSFSLSYKTNYDYFINPSVFNDNTKIKSSVCVFYLKEINTDISKKIIVVSDKKYISSKDGIYHYSDKIARTLLTAICHSNEKQCLLN